MFNKAEFSKILSNINSTYSSMSEFARAAEFDRAYISKYIHQKYDNPPTPKILEKIANTSKGLTTYAELMEICDYLKRPDRQEIKKQELEKYENILVAQNFSKEELTIVKNYLLSPSAPSLLAEFNFNKFEKLLETTTPNKKKFLLDFCPKFFLSIEKKLLNTADEIKSIFDKSNEILDNTLPKFEIQFYPCPVYGQISAGQPNWAEECLEGYLPIDPNLMNIVAPEECFFLRINGESMNKLIRNGAYALIRKQEVVENGEIAVVLVNGYDATLKKFTRQNDLIILEPMSNDPNFTTQVYAKDTEIKILGKYIGKFEINS